MYDVGDRVRVNLKKYLDKSTPYDLYIPRSMEKYDGSVVTIAGKHALGKAHWYNIEWSAWIFDSSILEPVEEFDLEGIDELLKG